MGLDTGQQDAGPEDGGPFRDTAYIQVAAHFALSLILTLTSNLTLT